MGTETERKFLVKKDLWQKVIPEKCSHVMQAYLVSDVKKTIRIRTIDDKGFITIKGKTNGFTRKEYEFEIPMSDAQEIIEELSSHVIEKRRNYVMHECKRWEVDEFLGLNEGLIIAEIELDSEDQVFEVPDWINKEVTFDKKYYNSYLALHPYSKWKNKNAE